MYFYRLKKVGIICLLASILCIIGNFYVECSVYQNYELFYNVEMWLYSFEYFTLLFSLVVTLPICWLVYYERKNNFLIYAAIRKGAKRYCRCIVISSIGLSFLMVFLISFVSLISSLYLMPQVTGELGSINNNIAQQIYKGDLMISNPLFYGGIVSIWRGFISAVITTLGVIFALYVKNVFVALIGPFIITIISTFFLQNLQFLPYRCDVFNCFDINLSGAECYNKYSFITCTAIFLSIIVVALLYFRFVKHEKVFEV